MVPKGFIFHYLSQTDINTKNQLWMKIMNNDSQVCILNFSVFVTVIPAISNYSTLGLTRSIEFTCPRVSGSTSGKTLWPACPWVFPSVDPSTLGRISLYLLTSLMYCYKVLEVCLCVLCWQYNKLEKVVWPPFYPQSGILLPMGCLGSGIC